MAELARIKTPLTREKAARGLVAAWQAETGALPSRALAELMLAQIWLETARGQSVICHNWGNITGSHRGNFWRPPWYEVDETSSERYRRLHDLMNQGQAPRSFRAYPDHEAGARDYVSLLIRRFPSIIEAAKRGDARRFAVAVRDSGYCPDCNPAHTTSTFEAFQDEFRRDGVFADLPGSGGGGKGGKGGGSAGPLVAVVVLLAAAAHWKRRRR